MLTVCNISVHPRIWLYYWVLYVKHSSITPCLLISSRITNTHFTSFAKLVANAPAWLTLYDYYKIYAELMCAKLNSSRMMQVTNNIVLFLNGNNSGRFCVILEQTAINWSFAVMTEQWRHLRASQSLASIWVTVLRIMMSGSSMRRISCCNCVERCSRLPLGKPHRFYTHSQYPCNDVYYKLLEFFTLSMRCGDVTVARCWLFQDPLRCTQRHHGDCVTAVFQPDTPCLRVSRQADWVAGGVVIEVIKSCHFFVVGHISKKCWNANWDHFAHYAKVSSQSRLLPRRRSGYKLRP